MASNVADMALHGFRGFRRMWSHIGRILSRGGDGKRRECETENRVEEKVHWLRAIHRRHPHTNSPADSPEDPFSFLVRSRNQIPSKARLSSRWWWTGQSWVLCRPDATSCTRYARRNP